MTLTAEKYSQIVLAVGLSLFFVLATWIFAVCTMFADFAWVLLFVVIDLAAAYVMLGWFGFGLNTAAGDGVQANTHRGGSRSTLDNRYQRAEYLLLFVLLSLLLPLLALMGEMFFSQMVASEENGARTVIAQQKNIQATEKEKNVSKNNMAPVGQASTKDNKETFYLLRVFATILGFLGGLFVYFRWQDERFKKDIREEIKEDIEGRFDRFKEQIEGQIDGFKKEMEYSQKDEFNRLQQDIRHLVSLSIAERFERIKREKQAQATAGPQGAP